jgi:hypothetical protein
MTTAGGARLTKTTTWIAAICGPFPRFAYPTLDTLAKYVYIYRTIRTLFVNLGCGGAPTQHYRRAAEKEEA